MHAKIKHKTYYDVYQFKVIQIQIWLFLDFPV
jgi:hypothetical protein